MERNKQKKSYSSPRSKVFFFEPEHCLVNSSTENATTDISSTHNVMKDAGAEQYSQQKTFNPIWGNMNE